MLTAASWSLRLCGSRKYKHDLKQPFSTHLLDWLASVWLSVYIATGLPAWRWWTDNALVLRQLLNDCARHLLLIAGTMETGWRNLADEENSRIQPLNNDKANLKTRNLLGVSREHFKIVRGDGSWCNMAQLILQTGNGNANQPGMDRLSMTKSANRKARQDCSVSLSVSSFFPLTSLLLSSFTFSAVCLFSLVHSFIVM